MNATIDQVEAAAKWLTGQIESDPTSFDVDITRPSGTFVLQVSHTTTQYGTQTIQFKPNGDVVLP